MRNMILFQSEHYFSFLFIHLLSYSFSLPAKLTSSHSPFFSLKMASADHIDLAVEMVSLLENVETIHAPERSCIYRVPDNIRRLNEDNFTPKMVSIGPLHFGHPALQKMEKYKLLYLKKFRERVSSWIGLDQLITFVEEIEPNIRLHYSEVIMLSQKEFSKVILLDCCFLFELYVRFNYDHWDGLIKFKPWLATTVVLDLILPENQLPFPELKSLYDRIFPNCEANDDNNPSCMHLVFKYFKYFNTMGLSYEGVMVSHFTDLVRTFHLPPLSLPMRLNKPATHIPSATELNEAGVTFRKSEGKCLMDFKFSGGVLEIPAIEIDGPTQMLFHNMLALEQCHYSSASYVTDYVAIMDFLINTSTDVDLLVREGIIVHWLEESNSVANLFNNLWKNITIVDCNSHHSKICQDLNDFCKSHWNRSKATLRHDYSSTPWQTAASVAAIVLILLSLTQTICSIMLVVVPQK